MQFLPFNLINGFPVIIIKVTHQTTYSHVASGLVQTIEILSSNQLVRGPTEEPFADSLLWGPPRTYISLFAIQDTNQLTHMNQIASSNAYHIFN